MENQQILSEYLRGGRVLLAPMVRIGTLPFRLLCLRNGADLVYSDEIIDIKLLKTKRIENDILKTVEYVLEDGTVVYQTCEEERGRNVIQIGSSCPERAALCVKHISNDVTAIDLNMGCPKPFSVKGGMGAALLYNTEKMEKILSAMVSHSTVPVSCKIRILSSPEKSLKIAQTAEKCNLFALTVHGRTPSDTPSTPNNDDAIGHIAREVSIPVVANGGSPSIKCRADAEKFRIRTRTSSVMLARCAIVNPSVFSHKGLRPMELILPEFMKLAAQYHLPLHLVKFSLAQMIGNWQPRVDHTEDAEQVATLENLRQTWLSTAISTSDFQSILSAFNFSDAYISEYNSRHQRLCDLWRVKSGAGDVICMAVDDDAKTFMTGGGESPKDLLLLFCRKRSLPLPIYETTEREDRRFYSVVVVNDKRFTSGRIEQRKKVSEQAAALAALVYLDAFT